LEYGTFLGVEAMRLKMLPSNTDNARFWGRERVIFENLAV